MSIIALTGGIGSGKSEAARLFAKLGVAVIDTDVISHQLTAANQPAIEQIRTEFGAELIQADGSLDRSKMRTLVFENPAARLQLENILHPLIHAEALAKIAENSKQLQLNQKSTNQDNDQISNYQIVVVPLLFELNQFESIANINLVIDCHPNLQIARAMARSQISEQNVLAIMQAQVSQNTRLKRADEVIENNGTIEELTAKVNQMHKKLMKICLKLA